MAAAKGKGVAQSDLTYAAEGEEPGQDRLKRGHRRRSEQGECRLPKAWVAVPERDQHRDPEASRVIVLFIEC